MPIQSPVQWPWRLQPQVGGRAQADSADERSASWPRWLGAVALALAYYAAGWWGIEIAPLQGTALTLVWPASGIALAAVLRYGYRVCAVIFVASAALSLPPITTAEGPLSVVAASAVLTGAGGALEPAIAALLISRITGKQIGTGPFLLDMLIAMPVAAAVGAVLLVAGTVLMHPAVATSTAELFKLWHGVALADYIGMVVLTPPLWLWPRGGPRAVQPLRLLEAAGYVTLAALALAIQEPVQPFYLLFVVFVAMVMRLSLAWAALAVAALSMAILWLTAAGEGPITEPDPYETFLATLSFVFAVNIASYLIALLWRDLQRYRQHLEQLVSEQTRELEEANARLDHLARIDPLTGAWNRRHFFEHLRSECDRAARSGAALCLIELDLDRFKAVNDHYGHGAGDTVLESVVQRLSACLRPADVLARTGGEEFSVLVVDCNGRDGSDVAERLRAAVAAQPVAGPGGAIDVTISAGVASWQPQRHRGKAAEAMITTVRRLVDRRLYAAKRGGRNRVVAGPSTA